MGGRGAYSIAAFQSRAALGSDPQLVCVSKLREKNDEQ